MPLHVGLTRSLFLSDGKPAFDFGLERLDGRSDIRWSLIDTDGDDVPSAVLVDYDAVIVELPFNLTEQSLTGVDRLRLVARVGVGYDTIYVPACTERGILLTITPDGVRRAMATAGLTLVLALSQHVVIRDRLTRAGRWDDRAGVIGIGLKGRTLGLVGLGNIGSEVARLAEPFEMVKVAFDPHVSKEQAAAVGCRLCPLEELLRTVDFVVVTCALLPETYRLIGAEQLALMRPESFLVNIARGQIVDQHALVDALTSGRIAGAGLDVFEDEPIDPEDPLTRLENTILTAHSIGWTDHCLRDCGLSAIESVIAIAEDRVPQYVVNREALQHDRWR